MLTLIGVKAQMATPFAANAAAAGDVPNTTWLARALFTDFLLPFEVAAVILTIAVIAAVMLTLRRRVGAKHQDPVGAGARACQRPPAHGQDGRGRSRGRRKPLAARRRSHDALDDLSGPAWPSATTSRSARRCSASASPASSSTART